MEGKIVVKPQTLSFNNEDNCITLKEVNNEAVTTLAFDNKNVDLIQNMIGALQTLENSIRMKNRIFVVPLKNIIVPQSFKKYFPNPEKILNVRRVSMYRFNKDIVVDRNMIIKDGYTAYLVAKYAPLEKVAVMAENGIATRKYGVLESSEVDVEIKQFAEIAEGYKLYVNGKYCGIGSLSNIRERLEELVRLFGVHIHFVSEIALELFV